jgi:hypothetical protein
LRALTRSMRRRSGQAKEEVLKLTEQTGKLLAKSVKEARRLAATARRRARGRGAQAKLRAARQLEELADLECPRSRGHLIAWVCPAQREGCGVHAQDAPAVPRGVSS